ncbi:carbon-nitrogen hydrolase family protein [Vibrio genomosp. F6]|uniref:carbon-nitrogen hydrolase family protein n=1 Tax=Vibrio genomosp. F6 TaxID=723172 RepID=UPI0010BD6A64|nr:carbon-nitrogen hydrolase family protein [Vibrio genomosp. F6]TKF23119.1 carbon-nitrogen hydrolase family protein [Vibrio genomosp. F6]
MSNVGIIQMTSGADPWVNLQHIEDQLNKFAQEKVTWVLTPENSIIFGSKEDYHRYAEPLNQGPIQEKLQSLARRFKLWLVIGSMPIRTEKGITTTTLVFDDFGTLVTHYDKLHMFDVDVADKHQCYRESETFTPGDRVVTHEAPFGCLGLSICYDVRFSHLYSELRRKGAQIIVVPAAFTAVTGNAHWEVLLRSRAIENQCWIVAAGQGGVHPCGRETWGHSMVIDPWGRVTRQLDQHAQNLVVEIDLSQIESIRQRMPILQHSRFSNQFY